MLKLHLNFITPEEEEEIIKFIRPRNVRITNTERNRVIRYGSAIPYKAAVNPIPGWMQGLCDKIFKVTDLMPDSVTINEYHIGQGIDWHIDSKESGPVITVLSLGALATMGLRTAKGFESTVILAPRSLLEMTGPDRWETEHSILGVEGLRLSIVFRKGT